jgi:hypothetical protein
MKCAYTSYAGSTTAPMRQEATYACTHRPMLSTAAASLLSLAAAPPKRCTTQSMVAVYCLGSEGRTASCSRHNAGAPMCQELSSCCLCHQRDPSWLLPGVAP